MSRYVLALGKLATLLAMSEWMTKVFEPGLADCDGCEFFRNSLKGQVDQLEFAHVLSSQVLTEPEWHGQTSQNQINISKRNIFHFEIKMLFLV